MTPILEAVEGVVGVAVREVVPLGVGSSGSGAILTRLVLADGRDVVAKRAEGAFSGLTLEAWMLRRVAEAGLAVPGVHYADDRLLIVDHCPSDGRIDEAQERIADAMAALHAHMGRRFGLERDTVIGPLPQPNGEMTQWRDFFAERRLLYTARLALQEGRIDGTFLAEIEQLCSKLGDRIPEGSLPSLIHGDIWGGNVLVGADGTPRFIDPAIYYADPEIELAYGTLFGTLTERFFARYQEHRVLEPGFEARRDLYNLYPLLYHARLFGGSYASQARTIVRRLL